MARVTGVVVAHGDLAPSMIRAVEGISGVRGALLGISNAGCTPQELRRRVDSAVGEGPALVFVDMGSGSCAFAALKVAEAAPSVAVVTGVSLPMLLDFVFHRDMEPAALAERVAGKGRTAARVMGPRPDAEESEDDGDRPDPG